MVSLNEMLRSKAKKSQLLKIVLVFANIVLVVILTSIIVINVINVGLSKDGNCKVGEYSGELQKTELNKTISDAYPKYTLYYHVPRNKVFSKNEFKGIPALYIHGHGGDSNDGVRLARSVNDPAKSIGKHYFDFFIVDFNEEESGFYGKFLETQSRFSYDCVKHISKLYVHQKSVVVIGHSMGGMVAMGMVKIPDFDVNSVAAMILLASPQQMPVATVDRGLKAYYDDVQSRWRHGGLVGRIAVASIGGENDMLVRTGLTSLSRIDKKNELLWTSTASIPQLWRPVNHVEFIWCKELHEILSGTLRDITDDEKQEITDDKTLIYEAFKQRLTSDYLLPSNQNYNLNSSASWIEIQLPWSLQVHKIKPGYVSTKLQSDKGVLILSTTAETNWFGACQTSHGSNCHDIKDNSSKGFLLPSTSGFPMKFVHLLPEDLRSLDYLAVSVPDTSVHLQLETLCEENEISINVPSVLSMGTPDTLLNGSLHSFYNISLQGFSNVLQVYTVKVDFVSCDQSDFVVFKLFVPWGDPAVHHIFEKSSEFDLKLVSNKPHGFEGSPQLQVFIPSRCLIDITVNPAFGKVICEFSVFYLWLLPAFFVLQTLIQLQSRHCQLIVNENIYSVLRLLLICVNILLVPTVALWKMFLSYSGLQELMRVRGLLEDDIDLLQDLNVWSPMAFIILFFMSFITVPIFVQLIELQVFIVQWIASRIKNLIFKFEKPLRLVHYFFPLFGLILSLSTCGAFALLLMVLFCFFKSISTDKKLTKVFQFNNTLLLLSFFHFLLNVVTLYLWLIGYEKFCLTNDPSVVHGAIACCGHFIINSTSYPANEKRGPFVIFTLFLQINLYFYVTHSTNSIYVASYLIDITLGLLAIHVLILFIMRSYSVSRNRSSIEENIYQMA